MALPTVTILNPNAGAVGGGAIVTISGTNFTGTTAVKFGTTNATAFHVRSASVIIATAPAGTGVVDITVTNATGTSATGTVDQFTFGQPVPVDPNATAATKLLLQFLYDVCFQQTGFTSDGMLASNTNSMRLADQILSGQDIFDAYNNGGSATKEFDLWSLTTGKTPAIMDAASDYGGNDANALSSYNAQGVCTINWSAMQAVLIAHATKGGMVSFQNAVRNIPTQYVGTATFAGSTSTVAAINALGTMTLSSAIIANFPTTGGPIKFVAQSLTDAFPVCYQGTYTSRSGNVLSGVVLVASSPATTTVTNGNPVYLAQLLPKQGGNTLTTAEMLGCYPLQYSASAYTSLPGAGNNIQGACSYNNTTTITLANITVASCTTTSGSPTISTTGNFLTAGVRIGQPVSGTGIPTGALVVAVSATSLTIGPAATANGTVTLTFAQLVTDMPITVGMYVTGTGIPANARVATATAGGNSFTLTAAATGGSHTGQTLTFTLGQSTDYANALLEDANANLNAMFDQLTPGFAALAAEGISIILRPFGEENGTGDVWFHHTASANCNWDAYIIPYFVGYMTGQEVFPGQPVSPNPVHNLLFIHAPLAGTTASVTAHPPIINGVPWCDGLGIDEYANDPSTWPSGVASLAALPGCGAMPHAACEIFGGGVAAAGDQFPVGYLDPAYYGSGTVDLSTLGGQTLHLIAPPDVPNILAPSVQSFAASGTVFVSTTSLGLQAVTYSGATPGPAPIALPNIVTSVPFGSLIISKGVAVQPVPITANNCGDVQFLTDLKFRSAYYMCWWGEFNQLFAELGTNLTSWAGDTTQIWLNNLSTYFTVPWAPRSATDNIAFGDTAGQTSAQSRTGADNIAFGDAVARGFVATGTASDNIAFGDTATRVLAPIVGTAADTIIFGDSASRGGLGLKTANDTILFNDAATRTTHVGAIPYLDFDGILNKLAGTVGLAAQGAANVWGGSARLELIGALNAKNGTTGLGLNLVVAEITGIQGYEATEALNRMAGWVPSVIG